MQRSEDLQPEAAALPPTPYASRALVGAASELTTEPPHALEPTSASEFKLIYEAHFKLVWRTLGRLGVREQDLMDVTQKVFMTVYLKLPEFEGRSLVSTWLWGICRRVASGYRRSGPIRYEVATDPTSLDIALEKQSLGAGVDQSSREAQLESILSKLSEAQRIVFLLYEVDEMDGREIASLLRISLGTVRSRLRYARKAFRREVRRLAVASAFRPADGQC